MFSFFGCRLGFGTYVTLSNQDLLPRTDHLCAKRAVGRRHRKITFTLQWCNINVLVLWPRNSKKLKPPRLIYHLFVIRETSCLSGGIRRWKYWRGRERQRETFCFWKIAAVSFFEVHAWSAAQHGTAGELEASRSQAALGAHERCDTPKSLSIWGWGESQ